MPYANPQGRWSASQQITLPVQTTAKDTKIAIPANLPPIHDGNNRGILEATLEIIDAATGALTETVLGIVTFATRTDDAAEIYWVDHHTIALPVAIAATQNFINLVYRPAKHGWQGKDTAAVAGTS